MHSWLNRTYAVLVITTASLSALSVYLITRKRTQPEEPELSALKYDYQAFQDASGEIRLLLLPRNTESHTKHSSDVYQLHIFPLDSAPPFEAISYTWGPKPHDDASILIRTSKAEAELHGTTLASLPASRKVRHILRSRNSPQRTGDRWVWMDSVCINQKDDAEKSLQVRQMGDIYRRASRVIICLDDPESQTPLRFRVVLKLLDDLVKKEKVHVRDSRDVKMVGQPSSWRALSRFLSHPYWSRMWIIQEAALAKRLFIFADGKLVAWDEFMSLWASISAGPGDFNIGYMWMLAGLPQSEIDKISLNTRQINDLVEIRNSRASGSLLADGSSLSGLKGLRKLLIDSRRSDCFDPRDKVFGLLGLVGPPNEPQGTIPDDIQPNYDVSAEEIFTRLAQSFCSSQLYEPLLPRSGIGYPRKLSDLPSWVPDWTSLPLVYLEETIFSAGGMSDKASIDVEWPDASSARLHVEGAYRVGVLAESLPQALVMDNNEPVQFVLDASALVEKHFPGALDSLVLPQGGARSSPKDDTLWRTLLMDCDVGPRGYFSPAPSSYGGNFTDFYELAKKDPLFNLKGSTEPSDTVEARRFLNTLSNSNERTFGVTRSFGMAMVPPLSRPGDEFYVIKGIRVPVLLRSVDSSPQDSNGRTYELVGDAYFHGMMKEEGLSLPSRQLELI